MQKITRRPVSFLPKTGPVPVKPSGYTTVIVQPCHYTILRHPLKDPESGGYSNGAVVSGIMAVHNDVVAMTDNMSINVLFHKIQEENHWFIRKTPGRYSVISFVFDMSFTFLVMQDGTYHKGWSDYSDFLHGERNRGINTL